MTTTAVSTWSAFLFILINNSFRAFKINFIYPFNSRWLLRNVLYFSSSLKQSYEYFYTVYKSQVDNLRRNKVLSVAIRFSFFELVGDDLLLRTMVRALFHHAHRHVLVVTPV